MVSEPTPLKKFKASYSGRTFKQEDEKPLKCLEGTVMNMSEGLDNDVHSLKIKGEESAVLAIHDWLDIPFAGIAKGEQVCCFYIDEEVMRGTCKYAGEIVALRSEEGLVYEP